MTRLPVVVAIPARNEADSIVACLAAIAAQPGARSRIAGVTVFANNCTDETVAVAAGAALPFPVAVSAADLPPDRAHIGHARRGAHDAALAFMAANDLSDAIIASTDADSRVAPDWLANLTRAFADGIDAVCGAIELDGPVSPELARARADEAAHADATARAAAWLDPRPHNPAPNHIWCWGANFAVRAGVLTAVGGSPLVALAEDRALHSALLRHDAQVRHARSVRVLTSARTRGRAPGGFADLLTRYASDQGALADFWLEPAVVTWARAARRGAARRAFAARSGSESGFGAHWATLEAADSALAAQPVAVADLPDETARLDRWLKVATGRCDNRGCEIARAAAPPVPQ